MTPEQSAAFVIAQAACAMAEVAAMKLENQLDVKMGYTLHHTPDDFRAVMVRFCIGHNVTLQCFQDANR